MIPVSLLLTQVVQHTLMCRDEVHTELCGFVHLSHLSPRSSCSFTYHVPPQYFVRIDFLHFDLEMITPVIEDSECAYNNFVTLSGQRSSSSHLRVLHTLCGYRAPFSLVVPDSTAILKVNVLHDSSMVNVTFTHQVAWQTDSTNVYPFHRIE